MNWISSKDSRPLKNGLYLITDGINWHILFVSGGNVMVYEEWDDGYAVSKYYLTHEWWWMPLPDLPDGKSPYYE